ncbi:hypothetical protein WR25_20313 [Diploscapter pachys]|uniref:Uncharacterized protein n=1 Tax=Diploscapter pachys TaxID=2018661 RepID=A0A2A2LPB2_9BILA|nr:hypothetical protein WR25_20313 [Diploscapter pachys]
MSLNSDRAFLVLICTKAAFSKSWSVRYVKSGSTLWPNSNSNRLISRIRKVETEIEGGPEGKDTGHFEDMKIFPRLVGQADNNPVQAIISALSVHNFGGTRILPYLASPMANSIPSSRAITRPGFEVTAIKSKFSGEIPESRTTWSNKIGRMPPGKWTKFDERSLKKHVLKATKTQKTDWKKIRKGKAEKNEKKLLKLKEKFEQKIKQEVEPAPPDLSRPYSVSIAVPGSFLNNAQCPELRTYVCGEIARAATLFCVNEIVIYDETCKMTDDSINSYWSGRWNADVFPSPSNYEGCFHLARILEYLECPSYLRKHLYPVQRVLKHVGLLHPLDANHHLKSDDFSLDFREGVILNKPVQEGKGPICNIGLDKDFQLDTETPLPAGTRITVHIRNLNDAQKRYRGTLSSPAEVQKRTGIYWGYTIRLAKSLEHAIDRQKYDVIVGVQEENSKPIRKFETCILNRPKILLVFGGVDSLNAAIERDEGMEAKSAEEVFDQIVFGLETKGARHVRTEESVLMTLSQMVSRLEQLAE